MFLSFLRNLSKIKQGTLSKERIKKLIELSRKLKIKINDFELLDKALTHTSFEKANGNKGTYERLEFLGDSILNSSVAYILYELCPNYKEGTLSALRASIVDEKTLSSISIGLSIVDYINLGRGETLADFRAKEKVSADVLEAIIGAIFIEKGFDEAFSFVERILFSEIEKRIKIGPKDFKTQLQKLVVAKYKEYPQYEVISENGPEHNKIFEVSVSVNNKKYFAIAKGRTKKEAEQKAAEKVLNQMKKEEK
ncbi:MAG: ribonuclease III [Brevinematales bacterium]|nr:ribonuclease III [Brevinematales bacterium]